jgi:hypothetical protein
MRASIYIFFFKRVYIVHLYFFLRFVPGGLVKAELYL